MTVYGYHLPSWQAVLRQPLVVNVLLLMLLSIGLHWVPPTFLVFGITYMTMMVMLVGIGFVFNTQRWWLMWLLGSFVWSMGMLTLCVWQLITIFDSPT